MPSPGSGKSHKARLSSSSLANPETPAEQLAAEIQDYLHFPDPGPLYITLGAIAGNMMCGRPVWLMLVGPSSCQPAGSRVLMADGIWKSVEDVKVGDMVISPQRDGKSVAATVLETVSFKNRPLLRVETKERNSVSKSYLCASDHIVPFFSPVRKYVGGGRKATNKWQPADFIELEAGKLAARGKQFLKPARIFTTTAVEFPARKYPVDPYIVGALLGDGDITQKGNPRFSNTSEKMFRRLGLLGVRFGKNYEKSSKSGLQTRSVLGDFVQLIKQLECYGCDSRQKFVPDIYKEGSVAQRLDLLAGLIDTDGSQTSYSSSSSRLAEDFAYLVHSVGGYASISPRVTYCNKKAFQSFRVYYSFGEHRPELTQKHKDQRPKTRRNVRHRSFQISDLRRRGDVFGFRLNSLSQWYVTDDWLVTHNCGKTEILMAMSGIPGMHLAEDLSGPGALLSGVPQREIKKGATGGLLRKVGPHGGIIMEDFTSSVMKLPRDTRDQILTALRLAWKGRWARDIGSDGGRTIVWEGKLAALAGGTPSIDRMTADVAELGERWMYYRFPTSNGWAESRTSMQHENPAEGAIAVRESVKAFFELLDLRWPCQLDGPQACKIQHEHYEETPKRRFTVPEYTRLIHMATLTARMRSAVYRHPYLRQIEDIPTPEAPTRLSNALGQLYLGLELIGIGDKERWRLISKVAFDSVPEIRSRVVRAVWGHMMNGNKPVTTEDLREVLNCGMETTRRIVEDLQAYKVVEKKGKQVLLTEPTLEELKKSFTGLLS